MFPLDLPQAVVGFVGVHLGLRAESARLVRLHVVGDTAGASRRAGLLARVLEHHHRAEDTVLFPALVERQPGVALTTAELEAEHTELDALLAAPPADLEAALALRRLVERHLGHEEHRVLPVWLASFTADEHDRFTVALRRSTPLRDAGLMISWLLDTAPDGSFELAWDQIPPALRLAHRIWVASWLRADLRHDLRRHCPLGQRDGGLGRRLLNR